MSADENVTRGQESESLQKQVEEKEQEHAERRLYGTFGGVFTPTLLTILGVIMYLREGWVVGHAGLLGAWLIILLSFFITGSTGISLSSITTNIRIGAGGAFNIISQSLGLEVGGSIGVPLFLAQALAVAMYIFGFRAGWQWIFPDHPALIIDLITFFVLFGIAFVSAGLAFRIQYLILVVIGLSLVSVVVAAFQGSMQHSVQWWGEFQGSAADQVSELGFWAVFAVFFPASTGIMAGANMSGELKNPRRSIPIGTLSAIALSLVVYLGLAYWLARSATSEELVQNFTVMIDKAAWGPLVLAGLLGATFSSALSSLVGAPRILQALGQHNIVPASKWLSGRSRSGEPRKALFLTGLIVFAALMLRTLNTIAPLITLFFLLTYAMINLVVFLEQSMNLVSFRPLLRVPRVIPLLGTVGCVFTMFVVNPLFSFVAVGVVLVIHAILMRRQLVAPFGDLRSGLFVVLAEWAAKKVEELASSRERAWKANLLVPVEKVENLRRQFDFICNISRPKGFIKLVGLTGKIKQQRLMDELPELTADFTDKGVFASWTVISAASFGDNLKAGIETFGGTFFKPNLLLLTLPDDDEREGELRRIVEAALKNKIGILLLAGASRAGLGRPGWINIWFTDRGENWELSMDLGNQDLTLLIGLKLKNNWQAKLRLLASVEDPGQAESARQFLRSMANLARIPVDEIVIQTPSKEGDAIAKAHLNIIPLPEEPDFETLRGLCRQSETPCLFTRDSGEENALA